MDFNRLDVLSIEEIEDFNLAGFAIEINNGHVTALYSEEIGGTNDGDVY